MTGPTDDHGRPLTAWGIYALVALVTCDEIGHACSRDGCLEVARQLVPWPGRETTPQCDRHYGWTLHVAGSFGMADLIRAGARPLHPMRREPDPAAERFAAMELD